MMAGPAYFPFYPRDFASDGAVEAMSTVAVGAYALLLCKAWFESPAGTLPKDDPILSRWARLSEMDWGKIKHEVLAAFRDKGDRYVQKRMAEEHRKLTARLNALSDAGKRGGRGRPKGGNSQAKARLKPGSSSAFDFGSDSESGSSVSLQGKSAEKGVELPAALELCRADVESWLVYKRERREAYKPRGLKALLTKLEAWGPDKVRSAIQSSMSSNYAGLFEPKGVTTNGTPQHRIDKAAREFDESDIAPRVFKFGGGGEAMG